MAGPTGAATAQYAPGPPTKKRRVWLWVVLGVVGLLAVGCVATIAAIGGAVDDAVNEAVDESSAQATPTIETAAPAPTSTVDQGLGSADASGDVVLGAPADEGGFGLYTVPVTVTNDSEKRSDYYIELAVENAEGVRLSELTNTFVSGLDPGQTAQAEATFQTDAPAETIVVRLLQVQRTAST